MASIFGPLDKRQRIASFESPAQVVDRTGTSSFEEREDLLNDLLEDDTTHFPLLSCPSEVLTAVLLQSEVVLIVRLRPLCKTMRGMIDAEAGLWSALILRDFADLGGTTKRYRGLRTLADAKDDSRAVRRLEWDALMICAPPALRYMLLASGVARRRVWNEHGRALGAGWEWFSSKVCRRMGVETFLRWATLQYDEAAVRALVGPLLQQKLGAGTRGSKGLSHRGGPGVTERQQDCETGDGACDADGSAAAESDMCSGGMRFRRGRSDQVNLSAAAVSDIYETVQRWHSREHCEMMRAHIKGEDADGPGVASAPQGRGGTAHQAHAACPSFSVTPTLDAAEAEAFATLESDLAAASEAPMAGADGAARGADGAARGAASRRIEDAQLKLALELSKAEAEASSAGPSAGDAGTATPEDPAKTQCNTACNTARDVSEAGQPTSIAAEPVGLPLHAGGGAAEKASDLVAALGAVVFLKDHCVGSRVEAIPDAMERSIEHIVGKMATTMSWSLLYESLSEELTFRAKSAAYVLYASNAQVVDSFRAAGISIEHERLCLPIWRSVSGSKLMEDMSKLHGSGIVSSQGRNNLLRQASLEWCEMEDLTEFLDGQLPSLESAIDNFRGATEASGHAHTPHVRDLGRLMFRSFCLLDSRIFRALCLAAYSLIHEVALAEEGGSHREALVEILEEFHETLSECDVADDHLSASKHTKDALVDHLLTPVTAAVERLTDRDIRGHPSRDQEGKGLGRRGMCRIGGGRERRRT